MTDNEFQINFERKIAQEHVRVTREVLVLTLPNSKPSTSPRASHYGSS